MGKVKSMSLKLGILILALETVFPGLQNDLVTQRTSPIPI